MNPTKVIYLFLFDTLSDWEIGYVTTGINNPMMQAEPGRYQLKTFSLDGQPITTMGGLKITPDISLNEVAPDQAAMLILPGGASWDEGKNQEVILLAKDFHQNKIKIAGICGATLGMAKGGLLDAIKHTSNSSDYLRSTNYQGKEYYVNELAVSDAGIVTASGTAPLAFAREIFIALNLYAPKVLEAWYQLFKTGSPEAFLALMQALGAYVS